MKSLLLYLYILFLPFSFAASLFGGRLTIAMVISFCMLTFLGFHLIATKSTISKKIIFYTIPSILFCLYVIFNLIITESYELKSILHASSYIVSICFFLIIPLVYGNYFKNYINNSKLFSCIFAMVLYSSIYAVLQFIFNNWFHIDLDIYIPWPNVELSNTMFLGSFHRAKGFAAEPGHFAFFLECFIPFVFYYLFVSDYSRMGKIFKILSFIVIIASLLFTVSAAAFMIIPIAILLSILLNHKLMLRLNGLSLGKIFIVLASVITIIFLLKDVLPIYNMIFTSSFDKLDSTSSQDRIFRLSVFSRLLSGYDSFTALFGYGPAATSTLGLGENSTIIFLFPLVIIELGFLGFFLFFIIFLQFFLKSKNFDKKICFYYHISLFSLYFHYMFIANYWYPYIWLLGALPYIVKNESRAKIIPQLGPKKITPT